jgi:hypothetical protein
MYGFCATTSAWMLYVGKMPVYMKGYGESDWRDFAVELLTDIADGIPKYMGKVPYYYGPYFYINAGSI